MVYSKFFSNYGQGARPVIEVDAKDVGFVEGHIGPCENVFALLRIVEDNPQHPVLNGVHHGHSGDIDFDFGEFAEDVSEDARFVYHKN
jgi:hypothetical protein